MANFKGPLQQGWFCSSNDAGIDARFPTALYDAFLPNSSVGVVVGYNILATTGWFLRT